MVPNHGHDAQTAESVERSEVARRKVVAVRAVGHRPLSRSSCNPPQHGQSLAEVSSPIEAQPPNVGRALLHVRDVHIATAHDRRDAGRRAHAGADTHRSGGLSGFERHSVQLAVSIGIDRDDGVTELLVAVETERHWVARTERRALYAADDAARFVELRETNMRGLTFGVVRGGF